MEASRVWSTLDVPSSLRYKAWREALCEAVFELELLCDNIEDIDGSISQENIGPVDYSEITLSCPQTIIRTKNAISRSKKEQLEFVVLQSGRATLFHGDKEVSLSAGDSILIDGREPYQFSTVDLHNLSFHLPFSWLQLWLPAPEKMIGQPIRGNSAWGRAILGMTLPIGSEDSNIDGDQLGALLGACLSSLESAPSAKVHNVQLARLMSILWQSAYMPGYCATHLALEAGVSLRYLHKLFASAGTTFGTELLMARLQSSSRMLQNPAFTELPVAEIGWRSGFSDPSHFSRRFRDHFGVSPGEFRSQRHQITH